MNQMLCTDSTYGTIQIPPYKGGKEDNNSLFHIIINMWPDLPLGLCKEEKPSFSLL